jgi:hypothetical protein
MNEENEKIKAIEFNEIAGQLLALKGKDVEPFILSDRIDRLGPLSLDSAELIRKLMVEKDEVDVHPESGDLYDDRTILKIFDLLKEKVRSDAPILAMEREEEGSGGETAWNELEGV